LLAVVLIGCGGAPELVDEPPRSAAAAVVPASAVPLDPWLWAAQEAIAADREDAALAIVLLESRDPGHRRAGRILAARMASPAVRTAIVAPPGALGPSAVGLARLAARGSAGPSFASGPTLATASSIPAGRPARTPGVAGGREAGVARGREAGVAGGREAGVAGAREAGVAGGREAGVAGAPSARGREASSAGARAGVAGAREARGREASSAAAARETTATRSEPPTLHGLRFRPDRHGATLELQATGSLVVAVAHQPEAGVMRLVLDAAAMPGVLSSRPRIAGARVTETKRVGRSVFVTLALDPGWSLGKVVKTRRGAQIRLARP